MLQSACAKMQGKDRKDNSGTTSVIYWKELQEKGKHSFPYTNYVKSELNTCMNCCVKLIYLMLKILELLKNERLSVHSILRRILTSSRQRLMS